MITNSAPGGNLSVVNYPSYYPSGILYNKPYPDVSFGLGGKELMQKNYLNDYFFGARTMSAMLNRFNQMDPLSEEYYSVSPYVYCGNNPVNRFDPDGMDWYRVRDRFGEWQYHYDEEIHSQHALNKSVTGGEYLGKTYTEGDIYYSLFGSKQQASSFEGIIYQMIDKAIIKDANYIEKIKNYQGGESIPIPRTDFSIEGIVAIDSKFLGLDSDRNTRSFSYENSSEGLYYVYSGKNSMKASMEHWVGNRNMPMDRGGWAARKKAYHIVFMNENRSDVISLRYNKENAQILLRKYNNLFNRKKP